MSKRAYSICGYLVLAAPIVAFYIFMVRTSGWTVMLLSIGSGILLMGWLWLAVWLLRKSTKEATND